jgi:hypothetical protein
MKSRQFTLGLMALILTQLLSFKAVAQCCVAPANLMARVFNYYDCGVPPSYCEHVLLEWQRVQKAGCTTPVEYEVIWRSENGIFCYGGAGQVFLTVQPGATYVSTIIGVHRGYYGFCGVQWEVRGICSDTNTTAWITGPSPGALPLTLLNFTAALNGKAAQLQWATATEINTKNFIIQRSIDAAHFQNIGSVNAVGNSTQITSYSFADAGAFNVGANKLYYRLQMVDKDGKFTYSNIAIVQIENEKRLVIYPNPVTNELKLSGHLNAGSSVNIQIINSVGQTVLRQRHNFNPGDFNTGIDVSKLPPGVYLVLVNDDAEKAALSIIKQ